MTSFFGKLDDLGGAEEKRGSQLIRSQQLNKDVNPRRAEVVD